MLGKGSGKDLLWATPWTLLAIVALLIASAAIWIATCGGKWEGLD